MDLEARAAIGTFNKKFTFLQETENVKNRVFLVASLRCRKELQT